MRDSGDSGSCLRSEGSAGIGMGPAGKAFQRARIQLLPAFGAESFDRFVVFAKEFRIFPDLFCKEILTEKTDEMQDKEDDPEQEQDMKRAEEYGDQRRNQHQEEKEKHEMQPEIGCPDFCFHIIAFRVDGKSDIMVQTEKSGKPVSSADAQNEPVTVDFLLYDVELFR